MSQSQQYWLPGYGLSRHVVLSQIQFFLGPSASARPFSLQGREGYLITGTPLTRQQIEDLTTMSLEYERSAAMRMSHKTFNGKSAQFINELINVGERERPADRKDDRERESERTSDRYVPSGHRIRQKQSW